MPDIVSYETWYEAVTGLAERAEDIANATATGVDTAFLATLQNKRARSFSDAAEPGRRTSSVACRMSCLPVSENCG